jgi:outer membrane protein OmpA-like peptidoglycan-associated protein
MRFPILATVMSIVLGGGLALADETQKIAPPMPTSMDVYFETDSSLLTSSNESQLRALANWAKCKKTNVIRLEGHSDPRGTVAHNAELSADRAQAVRDKLIELGTPRDRIVVTVYGELGDKRETFAEDRRVSAMPTKVPVIVGSR